jgi:hypothetical protein
MLFQRGLILASAAGAAAPKLEERLSSICARVM